MDRIKNAWRTLLVCPLLAAATLAAFWPVLHNAFLSYDDQVYVTQNPHLTGGLTWANVAWAFQAGYAGNWHPVTWLSHMLDVQLFGLNAGWHHLTSLLLHVANGLLLFLVLKRMTGALWRSAFVAALFALHPIHVESVAWIAERKDVLSGFFFMLTLWAYARYVEVQSPKSKVLSLESKVLSLRSKVQGPGSKVQGPQTEGDARSAVPGSTFKVQGSRFKGRSSMSNVGCSMFNVRRSMFNVRPSSPRLWYWTAVGMFTCGLMSKPMLVTLPFVLLLLDYWPLRRLQLPRFEVRGSRFKVQSSASAPQSQLVNRESQIVNPLLHLILEKVPFFALSTLSCVVTFLVQQHGEAVASFTAMPFGDRMAHAVAAYFDYLQQTFWPSGLLVFYPLPVELSAARTISSAALLAVLTGAAVFLIRRRPWAPVGWSWYLGILVPVIGLVQVGQQVRANRYTYLPLIGIFILVAWGLAALLSAPSPQGSSDASLPARALAPEDGRTPVVPPRRDSIRPGLLAAAAGVVLIGLALMTHRQAGFWRDNQSLFGHAVQVATNNFVAWEGLGIAALQRNDPKAALADFTRANACQRAYETNYENLYFIGTVLQMVGKGLEALPYLEQSRVPVVNRPYRDYRLGLSLIAAGRLAEAEAALRRAIQARPHEAEFQLGWAALLDAQGRTAESEQLLREVVNGHPELAEAHRSLADFLLLHNRPSEAEAQYAVALKLQPPAATLLGGYAVALSQQGKTDEAIRELEASLKLEPIDAQTSFNLAELLSQQGRKREAVARYAQALEADPKCLSALNNLAWLLATDPDAQIRNGPRAVQLAERACQLTEWKAAFLMGTLAAAYAEAGRFADAAAMAERARDLARADKQEDIARKNEQLLQLYRAGRPFREEK